VKEFKNEPILELRRAPIRAQLAGALQEHDAKPPVRVPVWVGNERREDDELISTDTGVPSASLPARAIRPEKRRPIGSR